MRREGGREEEREGGREEERERANECMGAREIADRHTHTQRHRDIHTHTTHARPAWAPNLFQD